MNKPVNISDFLLERYRIGEVTSREKHRVEEALSRDSVLAASLAALDHGDRDFRERFPPRPFFPPGGDAQVRVRRSFLPALRRVSPSVWGLCAAALVLAVVSPLLIFKNSEPAGFSDRSKGNSGAGSVELNVYLKVEPEAGAAERGSPPGGNVQLQDRSGVCAGNTVQLAYRVTAAASGGRYGVIFSIDGRSAVTLHYPYTLRHTTGLVLGKPVPLDEAYTLDDAPDYEIFFFVVGDSPLDIRNVLGTAEQLAPRIAGNPRDAFRQGASAFKGYEIKTVMLRKE